MSNPVLSPVVIYDSGGNELSSGGSELAPNGTQADQRLTVDNTVGGVQFSSLHASTLYVFWTSEDAECRVTFDGSAPTTTNGHVIPAGSSGIWSATLAAAAKFIRTGSTSAVIHASQLL